MEAHREHNGNPLVVAIAGLLHEVLAEFLSHPREKK